MPNNSNSIINVMALTFANDSPHISFPWNAIETPSKHQHRWSSGRIHRCHRCDPGSIPGRCIFWGQLDRRACCVIGVAWTVIEHACDVTFVESSLWMWSCKSIFLMLPICTNILPPLCASHVLFFLFHHSFQHSNIIFNPKHVWKNISKFTITCNLSYFKAISP